jgi:hypothetical protein
LILEVIERGWPETTLNYRIMMERYPDLKKEVSGSIPGCEMSSLPNGKLAKWSSASCVLALTCRHSLSKKKEKKKKKKEKK